MPRVSILKTSDAAAAQASKDVANVTNAKDGAREEVTANAANMPRSLSRLRMAKIIMGIRIWE
jgi:hypothetical protein